jgi:ATP-dependent 26S proteasome regulatory subunit
LRKSGRSLKRGLLLHSAPGTGKTLTAKWLSSSLEKVTVILLSGEQLWHVKECCQMARLLAPSLVIMEDVDLIAQERQASSHHTALHQLLNEMDGLESDAEVIFLLTTNQPDVIEPALAGRPGRVDQAIHFPLPDADCRKRLFILFGEGLDLTNVEIGRLVSRTDGASPAFIKELVRKAALIAAEKSVEEESSLRLSN